MKNELLQQLDGLTREIVKEFENELIRRLPDIKYEYSSSENLDIRIAAVNKNFGDIGICIQCKEITVLIGDRFHTHFDIDVSYKDVADNNSKQVIYDVLQFIEDIINEKILLRVKMSGERVISSSIVYADDINNPIESMAELSGLLKGIFSNKASIRLYSWSGIQKEIK